MWDTVCGRSDDKQITSDGNGGGDGNFRTVVGGRSDGLC